MFISHTFRVHRPPKLQHLLNSFFRLEYAEFYLLRDTFVAVHGWALSAVVAAVHGDGVGAGIVDYDDVSFADFGEDSVFADKIP